ncbi:hypothetical protein [Shewanella algae]|uniref:hypothetical protein n=1 Tax=Shewanella algae TaxID=38313 RepID=UPI000BB61423|nr:hypothetical protein [Shewanella algae]PBQ29882.1 hypothetical protein AYI97_03340 [Shewanella algae]
MIRVNIFNFATKFLWPLLLLVVFSPRSLSWTLNLDVRDNQVIALNAIPAQTGKFTISDWDTAPNLVPAKEWFPVLSPLQATIEVINHTGEIIKLPIEIQGLEFQFPNGFSIIQNDNPQGDICNVSTANGNVMVLASGLGAITSECSAQQTLTTYSNPAKSPFLFNRPIFDLDKIKSELVGRKLKRGNYNGLIAYPLKYFYFNGQGVFSYRVINKTFGININYRPDYIENITMPRLVKMEPIYNTKTQQASGSAKIPVSAAGYFEYGLKMYLENRDYTLKHMNGHKIPYSLICDTCSSSLLISQGVLFHPEFTHTSNGNKELIKFDLEVSFKDISVADIESGKYRDELTIFFEVDY